MSGMSDQPQLLIPTPDDAPRLAVDLFDARKGLGQRGRQGVLRPRIGEPDLDIGAEMRPAGFHIKPFTSGP